MKTTVKEIKDFLLEANATEIAIRIDRPKDFKTDPRKPTFVISGIGACAVHGASVQYLVVNLSATQLENAMQETVIESPDLDLQFIRAMREKHKKS